MKHMLDINGEVRFDESIVDFEWHSHLPYSSNSFQNGDEIRIPVHQTDVYTLPSKSFLIVEGKITKGLNNDIDTSTELICNAPSFLFDEIKYELCGTEIDRVKNVGITTTMKNILTASPEDYNWMQNAGWTLPDVGNHDNKSNFSYCIPLKLLLGFAEDFTHILLNVKQELVLLRSSNDKNVVYQPAASVHDFKLEITKIIWKVPYVRVEDEVKLSLLRITDSDQLLNIAFRRWQLFEHPSLPASKFQTWTVKTSSMLEKPRYVIVAFQTNRKDQAIKNSSHFDLCDLDNVKLYLNSKYYPYDNLNGNKALLYELYSKFQSSYYTGSVDRPCLNVKTFLSKNPMFVIDCSKQVDTLKTGSLDIRLEIQTTKDIPANTIAYCLIINDALVQYAPLSGILKKLM